MIRPTRPRKIPGYLRLAPVMITALVSSALASPAPLSPDRSNPDDTLCDRAARGAATTHGIPVDLLRAVAEVETGRRPAPHVTAWPWSLNVSGKSYRYDDRLAALAAIENLRVDGATGFDVGCFQINVFWHAGEFADLADMLDPWQNADYAARFLAQLYAEFGDWSLAAGAYHSRSEEFAAAYRQKIGVALARLSPITPPSRPKTPTVRRPNTYPLLIATPGTTTAGSLVPVQTRTTSNRPLF